MKVDLKSYNNSWYKPGANMLKRTVWYFINYFILNSWLPFSSIKVFLLRLFGAKIGHNVLLKPYINIKYPWKLIVGNYSWIGEGVWIDNLDDVVIGDNVCLSQGAMLLCGNHNYTKTSFDLMIGKIIIEDGCWIGAKSIVCGNVTCFTHSVLAVNSVATINLEPFSINQGNPSQNKGVRTSK